VKPSLEGTTTVALAHASKKLHLVVVAWKLILGIVVLDGTSDLWFLLDEYTALHCPHFTKTHIQKGNL
jgi:hypothetical protein